MKEGWDPPRCMAAASHLEEVGGHDLREVHSGDDCDAAR